MRKKSLLFTLILVFCVFGSFVFVNADCGIANTCSSNFTLCTSSGNVSCLSGCNLTTNSCDGREYLDTLNRTTSVDYLDNSLDVRYEYWGDSYNVHNIYANSEAERHEYDIYGNWIGEFYGSSEKDRRFSYDRLMMDMPLSTVSRDGDVIKFGYDNNGNLKSESRIVDGKKLTTLYGRDSLGRITSITDLVSKKTFRYDSQDCLVYEDEMTKIAGGKYKEFSSAEFVNDDECNIEKIIDPQVGVIEFSFQDVNYACTEVVNGSPIVSQCTYRQLAGKKVNDYELNVTYNQNTDDSVTYSSNTGGLYTPDLTYNSDDYLIDKDNMGFIYSSNYSEWEGISTPGPTEDSQNSTIAVSYSDEGYLDEADYSSELGDFNLIYGLDPLDEIAYEDLLIDDYFVSTLVGNVIRNLFTGFALFDTNPVRIYYASPGGSSSGMSAEEYSELIKSENVWPELAEYYNGSEDSDWLDYYCYDSDAGENDTLIFGAVDFGLIERKYDSCQDNLTLIENYCGESTFQSLDFWKTKVVPKTFIQACSYGCSEGRCLTASEIEIPTNRTRELPPEPAIPTEELT